MEQLQGIFLSEKSRAKNNVYISYICGGVGMDCLLLCRLSAGMHEYRAEGELKEPRQGRTCGDACLMLFESFLGAALPIHKPKTAPKNKATKSYLRLRRNDKCGWRGKLPDGQ